MCQHFLSCDILIVHLVVLALCELPGAAWSCSRRFKVASVTLTRPHLLLTLKIYFEDGMHSKIKICLNICVMCVFQRLT